MIDLPYNSIPVFCKMHRITSQLVKSAIADGRIPPCMIAKMDGRIFIHMDCPAPERLPSGLGSPKHPHTGGAIRPNAPRRKA